MDFIEKGMLDVAREFVSQSVQYTFTKREQVVIKRFFTNHDKKIFFVQFLPEAISTTLLSMYSRIKNTRGIRGHFVDSLLPLMLASLLEEFSDKNISASEIQKFINGKNKLNKKLDTLDHFVEYSEETQKIFLDFLDATDINPKYMKNIAASPKIKQFIGLFLDKYGHNSIARMGTVTFCVEGVSLLAAKSFEWSRPGFGCIELSTRFVDMQKAELYPVWKEFFCFNTLFAEKTKIHCQNSFRLYRELMNDNVFSDYLYKVHQEKLKDLNEKQIESAILGEVCDVLGNLLPAATLTSLGVSVSGEEFPELLNHLYLDATSENIALAEMIKKEAEKTGANQFLRQREVSPWAKHYWRYYSTEEFISSSQEELPNISLPPFPENYNILFQDCIKNQTFRNPHDKLPAFFETIAGTLKGVMSFRGWRDLHRQGFCAHHRTYLTPIIGFYQYDKPMPKQLQEIFASVHEQDCDLYREMKRDSLCTDEILQYPMLLGNLVGFTMTCNLRQAEFCIWQRTKFSVNHEVRKVFLAFEKMLEEKYPGWESLSRADKTPAYLFARTPEGIPM